MPAVTRFFFRAPASPSSTWAVIEWWESRRVIYNAAVGTAGMASLAAMALSAALPPYRWVFAVPWPAIVMYGIVANICYSTGPCLDAIICKRWGSQFDAVGPTLFRYGFVFSLGLTLLPVPLAMLSWAARLLSTFTLAPSAQ